MGARLWWVPGLLAVAAACLAVALSLADAPGALAPIFPALFLAFQSGMGLSERRAAASSHESDA